MRTIVTILLLTFFSIQLTADVPEVLSSKDKKETKGVFEAVQLPGFTSFTSPERANDDTLHIFYEDWESDGLRWETIDETDIGTKWHLNNWNAYGGTGLSWWMADTTLGTAGGYDNLWYQVIDSDPINLTGTDAPILTFYHRYKVEPPAGATSPYNGWDGMNVRISTNNGTTWQVLTNPTPAYSNSSLYSFGVSHGEGPGIPGWTGTLNTWTQVSFNLTDFRGQTVLIRFAFASDPAYSTNGTLPNNDPSMFGWQVDEIRVADGASQIFYNNGTSVGLTPKNNVSIGGNLWHIATGSGLPSGIKFANCNNSGTNTYNPNMVNSLISDFFYLPDTMSNIFFDFYLRGSFSDPNTFPDVDYFGVFVQVEGEMGWRYISNITLDPAGSNFVYSDAPTTWGLFSETYNTGLVDLTPLKGESIRVRFTFFADGDTPIGEALQVDDVVVYGIPQGGGGGLVAPSGLIGLSGLGFVKLVWNEMNTGGQQQFIYDSGTFQQGIHLTSGTGEAGALINLNETFTLDTVWIYGFTNNQFTATTLRIYEVVGPTISTTASFTKQITIQAGQWNLIDLTSDNLTYNRPIVVSHEIYQNFYVALDPSSAPSQYSRVRLGTGAWNTWAAVAQQNNLTDGEWGIRASANVTGTPVTYNVYRKPQGTTNYGSPLKTGLTVSEYFDSTAVTGTLYCYVVTAVYTGNQESDPSNEVCGVSPITSVDDELALPLEFALIQNYPNPFNPATVIQYSLAENSFVSLKVYDMLGKEIAVMVNENQNSGRYNITFDASQLSSGVYMYTLTAGEFTSSKKMLLMK